MALNVKSIKAMTKADLVSLLSLLLNALNALESGARVEYKIGDIVIAGSSMDYGVYAVKSATPPAPVGLQAGARQAAADILADVQEDASEFGF